MGEPADPQTQATRCTNLSGEIHTPVGEQSGPPSHSAGGGYMYMYTVSCVILMGPRGALVLVNVRLAHLFRSR